MNWIRSIKRRSLGFLIAGLIPAAGLMSQTSPRISTTILAGVVLTTSLIIGILMGWTSRSSDAHRSFLLFSPLITAFALFSVAIVYATQVVGVPLSAALSGVLMVAPVVLICCLPTLGFALIGQDLQVASSNKRATTPQ